MAGYNRVPEFSIIDGPHDIYLQNDFASFMYIYAIQISYKSTQNKWTWPNRPQLAQISWFCLIKFDENEGDKKLTRGLAKGLAKA